MPAELRRRRLEVELAARHVGRQTGLNPRGLIRALVAIGCIRVGLALLAGSGPSGVSHAATAVEWVLCASSQMLLVWLGWDVQKRLPGVGSLLRRFSYGALAGSLLPSAAGLPFFTGMGAAPALTAALAGWALTVFSATLMEWLLKENAADVRLPMEHIVTERLLSLGEVMHAAGSRTPCPRPL
jgi:hypothetical protein